MSTQTIVISIVVGLVIVLFLTGVSGRPFRWLGQLMVKVVLGAVLLFVMNTFGGQLGLHVPINVVTLAISGILGIPGLASLAVIQTWLIM